ncbi:MAG: O-antigen ligase family protein [Croceibacterium sp.]
MRATPQFWVLAVFLSLVFVFGGASRIDVPSLVVVLPLSAAVCAYALMTIRREHFMPFRTPVLVLAAVMTLCILHLIPLPPALWHSLGGRELFVEIDKAAGLSGQWRPLTISPFNGWHALLSLLAPLGILLLGIQLPREERFHLLAVVTGLAIVSGFLGILQVIGSPRGPLYFYRITNNGSAVGLFANRNHAAVLLACLFPMIATFASLGGATKPVERLRKILAVGVVIVNLPLLLVTGSRAGFAIGLLGLVAAAVLYHSAPSNSGSSKAAKWYKVGQLPLLIGAAIFAVGLLTAIFSRAEVIGRLFGGQAGQDTRGEFWAVSMQVIRDYFPWGSGVGSFVEAYEIREPVSTLGPQYVNHAHNDWIEIVLTMGLPGFLLLLVGLAAVVRRSWFIWIQGDGRMREVRIARLASVVMAMLALASITDYPLRTPALSSFFALCVLWLFSGESSRIAVSGKGA